MRAYLLRYSLILSVLFTITLSHATHASAQPEPITIKILGINDFHGQISTGRIVRNEPVGGAAVLAAYLKKAQTGIEERTLITIMGDQVGASPPASGLLHDEPSILFTNSLGNRYCNTQDRMNPLCNIVATVGNHEFDKGQQAMFDLMYGNHTPPTNNWIDLPFYPGASYPYISANIVDAQTEKPLFPPYIIKSVDGIPVAFIGAILKSAAANMFPANAEGIKFLDEAETINHYIPEIKAQGAKIIVVIMHEGGNQIPYEGETRTNTKVEGNIIRIVDQLDDSVDVVMGGHTHQFLNAFLPNHNGVNILVTQANSYSSSFAEVTLQVDAKTHRVQRKTAQIVTTYANRSPGTTPDEPTQQLLSLAEKSVAPIITSYVGTTQNMLSKRQNDDGESNLGNLVADAFKNVMGADLGMTNPHGIRNDIQAGIINWGSIYAVIPFSNHVNLVSLTGNDIYELLEQQWMGPYDNILQISGITYTYNPEQPVGHKVLTITHDNKPLLRDKTYTIAAPDFLVSGAGVFSVMTRSKMIKVGETDLDTMIHYIKGLSQPFSVEIDGRIKKVTH